MGEKKIATSVDDDYMTLKEVCAWQKCGKDAIYRRIKALGFPFYDLGDSKKAFSKKAIELWLKKRSVNT